MSMARCFFFPILEVNDMVTSITSGFNKNQINNELRESLQRNIVLYAKAIGLEELQFGANYTQVLKLDYKGVTGYLPKQLIDNYEFRGLVHFIGKEFEFIVEDFDSEGEFFIANRIKALEVSQKKFWAEAQIGDSYNAFVSGVDQSNLYLSVDGVQTVMGRAEASYDYIPDLREYFEIGTLLPVKIMELKKPGAFAADGEKETNVILESDLADNTKDSLEAEGKGVLVVSAKALTFDPWLTVDEYKVNSMYIATVRNVHFSHGIFLSLPSGITIRTNFPTGSKLHDFTIGKEITVRIRSIDKENQRISAIIIRSRKNAGVSRSGRKL